MNRSARDASPFTWVREAPDRWVCRVDDRFTLSAAKKGDGRWAWQVVKGDARNPMASGIVSTPGDAKHAMEHFLKKAGFV